MDYFGGVAVAFIIGLIKLCIAFSLSHSQRARNMAKVGLHYSYFNGTFNLTSPEGWGKVVWFTIYLLIIAPIFSWLSVISAAWMFISARVKQTAVPEKLKEIQFKIAHVDLTKDQMTNLLNEISEVLQTNPIVVNGSGGETRISSEITNSENDEDSFTLVLETIEDSDWYLEVSVEPKSKLFHFHSHPPDYDGLYYSTYEYKFENTKLLVRLIEDYSDHIGKIEFNVKDNVVVTSEISKRHAESSINIDSLEEKIESYSKQVEWHEFKRHDVRFFIMSKHIELFPPMEFRKTVRQELERIRSDKGKFQNQMEQMGFVIHETEEGFQAKFPKDCTEEQRKKLQALYDEKSKSNTSLVNDMYSYKDIENCLLKWLDEDVGKKQPA